MKSAGPADLCQSKSPALTSKPAGLLQDLRETLGLTGLRALRIYNRYDVAGLTDDQYRQARTRVFAEPPVDEICRMRQLISAARTLFSPSKPCPASMTSGPIRRPNACRS